MLFPLDHHLDSLIQFLSTYFNKFMAHLFVATGVSSCGEKSRPVAGLEGLEIEILEGGAVWRGSRSKYQKEVQTSRVN